MCHFIPTKTIEPDHTIYHHQSYGTNIKKWVVSALLAAEVCFEKNHICGIICLSMNHAGKSRDGLYEPVLAESEREAVADLLQYLENVRIA